MVVATWFIYVIGLYAVELRSLGLSSYCCVSRMEASPGGCGEGAGPDAILVVMDMHSHDQLTKNNEP